jgi:RNA polymerase sigma-70 factor, ECF subfamily
MIPTMTLAAAAETDVAARVHAAVRGDAQAQAWLYRRFLPWVHGLLLSRRPAVADELAQDCFATAFQRLHQLREPAHFGAWIGAIARHQRGAEPAGEEPIEFADAVAAHDADPAQHVEALRMLAAIRALPDAYRETMTLRLVEGLGGPEIAELTGLAPGSVRVNLHRGMRLLRAALGLAPVEHDHD